MESPFTDEVFVLRAGLVEAWSVENNATNHMVDIVQEEGRVEWAVSVAAREDASVHDIAMEAGEKVWGFDKRDKMRVSTVLRLRERGYDVVPDDLPHALIMLPTPPTTSDYEAVSDAFDPPIANPAYKGDPNGA